LKIAYVLAKTPEDKLMLKGLQDSKNPKEKEEKIIYRRDSNKNFISLSVKKVVR
jgi:hypothetical protein